METDDLLHTLFADYTPQASPGVSQALLVADTPKGVSINIRPFEGERIIVDLSLPGQRRRTVVAPTLAQCLAYLAEVPDDGTDPVLGDDDEFECPSCFGHGVVFFPLDTEVEDTEEDPEEVTPPEEIVESPGGRRGRIDPCGECEGTGRT